MSLLPYEDPSASYQRQLKKQSKAAGDISETAGEEETVMLEVSDAAVEVGASQDIVRHVSEASDSAGETTTAATQTTQDTAAPPSDGPKKE